MARKSDVTQELVNIFPSWSKVRTDDQSVGQLALNTIAISMERMEKQIRLIRDNQYLTTANLNEIDLLYKVELDADFSFDQDTSDPLFVCNQAPTVSGLSDGTWYPVSLEETNSVEEFWYESVPNRVSLQATVSGEDYSLWTFDAEEVSVTGIWDHHLDGGRVWVEATGGVQYLNFEDNQLFRGKVILSGETRKGTFEEETLIFPWDMKQPTTKEWTQITEIQAFDIEDEVEIEVRSGDFNGGPYISPWNLKYSDNRTKVDEFWDLGHNGTIPTLDRLRYQTDEWEQLVLGFSSKSTVERFELLDASSTTVSGVDMTIQPYSDRLWVATEDKLYLYDLSDTTVSGIDDLQDSTPGANIQLDYETNSLVLGESIEFEPWHARPLKEIQEYRIWYKQPDGQKYGLLNGAQVAFTSDFTIKVPRTAKITRAVEQLISIPTTQRGEYLIVFEVTFVDGDTQEFRRIFTTKYKQPLEVFDLSAIVPATIDGIDFDADQKLWVKSGTDYYQITPHTDIMLIDYSNKIIYFKEEYAEVGIETS